MLLLSGCCLAFKTLHTPLKTHLRPRQFSSVAVSAASPAMNYGGASPLSRRAAVFATAPLLSLILLPPTAKAEEEGSLFDVGIFTPGGTQQGE